MSEIRDVADIILESDSVVALTGAGVSAASGIPTFRDDSGEWHDPYASRWAYREVFDRDPADWYESFWQFRNRREGLGPSPAHYALKDMVEAGFVDTIVTQNVDSFDVMAGTPESRLLEIHGHDRSLSCANWEDQGCDYRVSMEEFLAANGQAELPLCPDDGDPLKPDIILIFDNYIPAHVMTAYEKAPEVLAKAGTLLVVGSSLPIIPWFEAARDAGLDADRSLVVIDPNPVNVDVVAQAVVRAPAEEALPELRDLLITS